MRRPLPTRRRDPERRGALATLALLLVAAGGAGLARSGADLPRPDALAAAPDGLNGASESGLALPPGLGPDRARRIVVHRAIYGPFEEVADVERVKGIGASAAEKLRPHAVAGPRRAR